LVPRSAEMIHVRAEAERSIRIATVKTLNTVVSLSQSFYNLKHSY